MWGEGNRRPVTNFRRKVCISSRGYKFFSVDEDGTLYTLNIIRHVDEKENPTGEIEYCFRTYDLSGTCTAEKTITPSFSGLQAMCAKDGTVYLAASVRSLEMDVSVPVFYSFSMESGVMTELCTQDNWKSITRLVVIEDKLFFLGNLREVPERSYVYNGETVAALSLEENNPTAQLLAIEFPISIAKTSNHSLMIYQYSEENGNGFLEYLPKEEKFSEVTWKDHGNYLTFTICNQKNSYLYNLGDRLYLASMTEEKEAEIEENLRVGGNMEYVGGFAFYKNELSGKLERLCVSTAALNNKTIRLIAAENISSPFGCGYWIENKQLDLQKFALKVLAQDKDYDMCFLSSRDSISYNLKENGAFYLLNEVEGVQEYLDACFPYIKEAATTAEGDIWMLPISVAIPGILYHKEVCEAEQIDFAKPMEFAEFIETTRRMQQEKPELVSISTYVIEEEFFNQYLRSNIGFDTDSFRKMVTLLQQTMAEGEWHTNATMENKLQHPRTSATTSFAYLHGLYQEIWLRYAALFAEENHIGISGIPKLSEDYGNIGTCTFLAVNPASKNLKETLNYISTYVKHCMGQKDSLLFSEETLYTDTPYMKELYQLYAEGEIIFALDRDIYWDSFSKYMEGELPLEDMITEIERKKDIYFGESGTKY